MTVVIMNLFRGHKKCYFTILPTSIFEQYLSFFSQLVGDSCLEQLPVMLSKTSCHFTFSQAILAFNDTASEFATHSSIAASGLPIAAGIGFIPGLGIE